MSGPNKSLGQHWLHERTVLAGIADLASIKSEDAVLEIGPGLGTLTSVLVQKAAKVTAVEFDKELASKLAGQFPGKNLEVFNEDILSFDLSVLSPQYKVVANVPYYITSKIIHTLMNATNKPSVSVLLVQKEVAERLAAKPGDMSILAISAQVYAEVSLGDSVPARLFTPPPKVDSQSVVLRTREIPLVPEKQEKAFFRIVKAGFSAKRKKLRTSLSGGLGINKTELESLLDKSGVSPDNRAQDLSIADWLKITDNFTP